MHATCCALHAARAQVAVRRWPAFGGGSATPLAAFGSDHGGRIDLVTEVAKRRVTSIGLGWTWLFM